MKKIEPLPNKGNQSIIDLIAILGNKSNEHTLAINSLIEEVEGIQSRANPPSGYLHFHETPTPDVRGKIESIIWNAIMKYDDTPDDGIFRIKTYADEIIRLVTKGGTP